MKKNDFLKVNDELGKVKKFPTSRPLFSWRNRLLKKVQAHCAPAPIGLEYLNFPQEKGLFNPYHLFVWKYTKYSWQYVLLWTAISWNQINFYNVIFISKLREKIIHKLVSEMTKWQNNKSFLSHKILQRYHFRNSGEVDFDFGVTLE